MDLGSLNELWETRQTTSLLLLSSQTPMLCQPTDQKGVVGEMYLNEWVSSSKTSWPKLGRQL